MRCHGLAWVGAFLAPALFSPLAFSQVRDKDQDLGPVRAMERAMQQAIEKAEGAVASIVVSRSDAYQRHRQPPPDETRGKLGGFRFELLQGTLEEKQLLRRQLDLSDPRHIPEAFGSGVVIDPQGLILTNYHVVEGATKIFVRFAKGQGSYADIHAADPRSDLAVLRILDSSLRPLPTLPLGDASQLRRGQFLLSLANPFAAGFRDGQPTASWGILGAVRRRPPGPLREEEFTKTLHHYGTLLQVDTRLQLGCSGGALLNLEGEWIGLTSSLAALQGSDVPGGFAIPLHAGMRRIIEILRRGEEVEYGFLGISLQEPLGMSPGVVVKDVYPGSPAEQAKLQRGDLIVEIEGSPIQDTDDLFLNLGLHLAGNKIKIVVRRAGGKQTLDTTLAKYFVAAKGIASSPGSRPMFRGLRVDYSSLLVQQAQRWERVPPGVLITEVEPKTAAAAAQLKPGEIISRVNGKAVYTPAAFYQAASSITGPLELTLHSFTPNEPAPKVVLK